LTDADASVQNAVTPSISEGSEQMSEELGPKNEQQKPPHVWRKIHKRMK